MGGTPDWEEWVRDQLAGPERAALRAHRLGRVGRAVLGATSLLSTVGLLLGLAAALRSSTSPQPTESHVTNHR